MIEGHGERLEYYVVHRVPGRQNRRIHNHTHRTGDGHTLDFDRLAIETRHGIAHIVKGNNIAIIETMLGLGDIVIPGLFIALMLRWDVVQCAQQGKKLSEGKKIYFYAQMTGYVLGLMTTVVMMIQFKAAQPALLYLVPAAILSAVFTAAIRGQISQLFAYSEEAAEAPEDEKKSK